MKAPKVLIPKIYGPETPGYAALNAAQESENANPKGVAVKKKKAAQTSREQEQKKPTSAA